MSPIRIQSSIPRSPSRSPWARLGLAVNPFPATGIDTDVDYEDHQREQIDKINTWLTTAVDASTQRWTPMVLKGSIGVGKTHVLRRMEREIREFQEKELSQLNPSAIVTVSRHSVPGISSKSLLLSSILAEGLRTTILSANSEADDSEFPILHRSLSQLTPAVIKELPSNSPLRVPLRRICKESDKSRREELHGAFESWLARREIPRAFIERLGVTGKLEAEGEAIRAYAHVALLARKTVGLRAWVLLIDQLEDLWRKNEVTPAKRARFLTDLRMLVDEALEGAPIAIVLAWNTDVVEGARRRFTDIDHPLKTEYVALWSRLPPAIDIPSLPREHIYAFAKAYVDSEHFHYLRTVSSENISPKPDRFLAALSADISNILKNVPDTGRLPDGTVIERAWLSTLRTWAEEYVRSVLGSALAAIALLSTNPRTKNVIRGLRLLSLRMEWSG